MTDTSTADRFAALDPDQRVRLLRRLVAAGRVDAIPAVVPPSAPGPVPLTPGQQDLWAYQVLHPESAALNLCCAYHFDGSIDPDRLAAALRAVLARHDVLRTRVAGAPDALRVEQWPVERFQLERVTAAGPAEVLAALAARPFDLGRDPLVRAVLVDHGTASTLGLCLHHLVMDWWSYELFHSALAEAYLGRGDRPHPPLQYADVAAWQREREAAGVLDAKLGFWRSYLADPPAAELIPACPAAGGEDSARPGDQVAHLGFSIEAGTTAAVGAFARARGTTVYGVLMSAFAVFAHRLTGAGDLVIGTPVADRAGRGLAGVMGYLVNPVPTRWRIRPGDSFTGVLDRFAGEFRELRAHAEVPVGRIAAATAAATATDRDLAAAPLFRWVFMYLPRQRVQPGLAAFPLPERIPTGGDHDLVAAVWDEGGEGLAASFEVRLDRYPPAVATGWAEAFTTLLAGLVAAPQAPVSSHRLLPATQLGRLRRHRDGGPGPAPVTLPQLLADRVRDTPEAVAVESPRQSLTYARLADRVARLAGGLAQHGAGPERVVAVALADPVAVVVAALAAQWAGAAFLPLDPGWPADRVRFLLADAAALLLLTDPATGDRLADPGVPALDPSELTGEPVPPRPVRPATAAYVIYTSGSTGTPKGTVVTHAGIAALAAGLAGRLGLDRDSRILQFSSPAFDLWVSELVSALGSGGTLVVPAARPLAGDLLAAALRQVTHALLPPSVLASVPAGDYPRLRRLVLCAEPCPPSLVTAWSAGHRPVHNGYGPTEATCAATLSGELAADGSPAPIGRPLPGTRVHLLDRYLQPVAVGVPGELYLAGAGLARCYLGRPGLTAQRFLPDPAGPPGARMYRTGDLARWRVDGQLDFLGRADDQVKIRGVRIEPGEVVAALLGQPCVAQAAVLPRDGRLVAYLVPAAGEPIDQAGLREQLAARLPPALVPDAFVELTALPLTVGGKLDRTALPDPQRPAVGHGRAPAGPREQLLCRLVGELLGVAAGPDDDFFALGGDSVGAIQLAARAATAGLTVTAQDVFAARTPAALAARIDQPAAASKQNLAALVTLREGAGARPLFCLPPAFGLGWSYLALLPHLRADRPVYALQSPVYGDGGDHPASVEELAESFLARIRAVQPAGPYQLLGRSFGGLVAYQLAVLLRRAGQPVGLVGILDTMPVPPAERGRPLDPAEVEQVALGILIRNLAPDAPMPEGPLTRPAVFTAVRAGGGIFADWNDQRLGLAVEVCANHIRISHQWRPPPYAGKVTLIAAAADPAAVPTSDKLAAWRRTAAAVEVHELDCAHSDLLRRGPVAALGALIESTLGDEYGR